MHQHWNILMKKLKILYEQLQSTVDLVPNKDVMVVQGDWNAKVGTDTTSRWPGICGKCTNAETNECGLRLLKFADFNDLMLANTYGQHKNLECGLGIALMGNTIIKYTTLWSRNASNHQ